MHNLEDAVARYKVLVYARAMAAKLMGTPQSIVPFLLPCSCSSMVCLLSDALIFSCKLTIIRFKNKTGLERRATVRDTCQTCAIGICLQKENESLDSKASEF